MTKMKWVTRATRRAMAEMIDEHIAVLDDEIEKSYEPGWCGPATVDLIRKREGMVDAKYLWNRVWRDNRFKGDAVALREFVLACNKACVDADFNMCQPEKHTRRGYGKAVSFAEGLLSTLPA